MKYELTLAKIAKPQLNIACIINFTQIAHILDKIWFNFIIMRQKYKNTSTEPMKYG